VLAESPVAMIKLVCGSIGAVWSFGDAGGVGVLGRSRFFGDLYGYMQCDCYYHTLDMKSELRRE